MRIAINTERVEQRGGGAEKYALTLARALAQAGHEVSLVAQKVVADELPRGVRAQLLRRPWWTPRFLRAYQFAVASEAYFRREPHDLVIGFSKVWRQDVFLAVGGAHPATLDYSSRRFRSPLARALWRLGKSTSLKQWVFRAIAQRQFHGGEKPLVIAPSRMVAEHFQHYHGLPAEQIEVVYNAWEPRQRELPGDARAAFRARHRLAERDVAVLFAARNYQLKGLEPLLAAFAPVAWRHAEAKLVICGSGRDAGFRAQAQRLGIESQARFLGSVEDIQPCYAGCDLFAFPTFYDPCSLVILEALSAGLPVITTRQNGAAELLEEGVTGLVVSAPWQLAEMSDALERLVADQALRNRMASAGRAEASRWSMNAQFDALWTALRRASHRAAGSPRREAA